jgi:hypothetical protein
MSGSRLVWQRALRCGNGACVEVSRTRELVHVRDSKDRNGPVLTFTRGQWQSLLSDIRAGSFDDSIHGP